MGIRIIGGVLKGRRLKTLQGRAVRPTSDRVRESIFNILANQIRDAAVLDLFAGSGALGIEALSRGAASVIFIDKSPQALTVINQNLRMCRPGSQVQTIRWDIVKNLNCLTNISPQFNFVFMDPPYNQRFIRPALAALIQSRSMARPVKIVVEHDIDEPIPEKISPLILFDQRRYRKTLVSFLMGML